MAPAPGARIPLLDPAEGPFRALDALRRWGAFQVRLPFERSTSSCFQDFAEMLDTSEEALRLK